MIYDFWIRVFRVNYGLIVIGQGIKVQGLRVDGIRVQGIRT